MSFGYGVMVTTLQMATAYAAIANGGILMKPYIVDKITAPDGKILFQNQPAPIRRVVTPDVASTLTGILVDVVEHGTGVFAKVSNFLIAGKTGTAEKLVDGKYSKEFYHASFAGFFPVPNPEIAGYIMINSPTNAYTGGMVAAPIFKRIAERIYGIIQQRTTRKGIGNLRFASDEISNAKPTHADDNPPRPGATPVQLDDRSDMVRIPDVVFLDHSSAEAILNEFGFKTSGDGGDGFVVRKEIPGAGTLAAKGKTVRLLFEDAKLVTRMPDFRGASVRAATSFLLSAGIPFQITGSGPISSQSPSPGVQINKRIAVKIVCSGGTMNFSELY